MTSAVGGNMHLIRANTDKNFPWLAVLPVRQFIGFWYWCTDQYIVQRVLAGKNQKESRRGSILAGYLKLTPVFIFMVPRYDRLCPYQSNELSYERRRCIYIACRADPASCIRGIVACGMLTALMASLASKFNASATLFTMDFYQKWHPTASGKTQVLVGRIATGVIVLWNFMDPVMKTLGKISMNICKACRGICRPPSRYSLLPEYSGAHHCARGVLGLFSRSVWRIFPLGIGPLIGRPLKDGTATAIFYRRITAFFLIFSKFIGSIMPKAFLSSRLF